MPYRIRSEETLPDSIRRIVRKETQKALAEIDDPELDFHKTVHQVRKRCKKARGALRLVRSALPLDYTSENRRYRDAARRLSDVRDAQSMIETVDRLTDAFARCLEGDAFSPIRELLVAHREALTPSESRMSDLLFDFRRRMEQGLNRIDAWEFARSSLDAMDGGLKKTYRRARKSFEKAYCEPTTAQFHEWRKRVKYHWYQMRLLHPIWNAPIGARKDQADLLADMLGDDHDLSVLRNTVLKAADDFSDPKTVQTLLGLMNQRQTELRLRAKPIGARLFAEKPGAFVDRIRCYRDAWYTETRSTRHPAHRPELVSV